MHLQIAVFLLSNLLPSNKYLIPGGENITFEMKTNGIIITNTYEVKGDNTNYNPSSSDIKSGDIIKAIEGYKVYSIQEFKDKFEYFKSQDDVDLSLLRDGELIKRSLKLIQKDNEVKTGLYVKDRIIGLGTVSFYDPDTYIYGALGHEVFDKTSSSIVDLKAGNIYSSYVNGIKNTSPVGEKIASKKEEELGDILYNSKFGIYGKIDSLPDKDLYKMALQEEVKLGKAQILTVTKGNKVESYDINIINTVKQDSFDIKGIEFEITDKDFFEVSNGIYYGMSGSSIIQDDKIVGAVTHVKYSDTRQGYGIYMETMIDYVSSLMQAQ